MVVGAGLGGLTTATALALGGHTVTVIEQAPVLKEVSHKVFDSRQATTANRTVNFRLEQEYRSHLIQVGSFTDLD